MDILRQIVESETKIKDAEADGVMTVSGSHVSSFHWASTQNKEYLYTEARVEKSSVGGCGRPFTTTQVQPPYTTKEHLAFDGDILYSLYKSPQCIEENGILRPLADLQISASIAPYFQIDTPPKYITTKDGQCRISEHWKKTVGSSDYKIEWPKLSIFESCFTPRSLLGHTILQDRRANFSEKFSTADEIRILSDSVFVDNNRCTVLQGQFTVTGQGKVKILAWIDTQRDYRLLRLDYYLPKYLWYRIDNIRLEQINGIWFPVRGRLRHFHKRFFWTYRFGAPQEINLTNIRLNQDIPDEKFVISFPPDCRVFDAFQNKFIEPEK